MALIDFNAGWAGVRRWLNAERLIGIAGILIGVAIGLPSQIDLSDPKSYKYLLFTAIFSVVALIIINGIALYKIGLVPRSLTESELLGLSSRFAGLMHKQLEFESAAAACVKFLFASAPKLGDGSRPVAVSDEELAWNALSDDLDTTSAALLSAICDTAAYVLSLKHGGREEDVSVNIKRFGSSKSDPPEPIYVVQKRSANSSQKRDDADTETRKREFRVDHHMIYRGFFGDHSEGMVNDICVVDDIDKYIVRRNIINETRIQKGLPAYKEPSEKAKRFYKSCIVAPIAGNDSTIPIGSISGSQPRTALTLGDGRNIIGILCADSVKKSYFDRGYDVEIMRQLALHAFSVLRSMYGVDLLKSGVVARKSEQFRWKT